MAEDKNQNITQTQMDSFETPLTVPANKLDADQYAADDLDGVTESIFGSGNMAYASLQASQTDAALNANDAFALSGNENFGLNAQGNEANLSAPTEVSDDQGDNTAGTQSGGAGGNNDDIITDTDRSIDSGSEFNTPNGGNSDGNFASSTVGSVSASQLSSDVGSFAPAGSGLSLSEGLDDTSASDGSDGETPDIPEIPTPTNGENGQDGSDGMNAGGGDTNINVDLGDINIDLGDTIELLDTTLVELGDTISTLTTSLTEITEVLGGVLISVTDNLFDVTNTLEQVTNLTENLTENITNTLTEITNITNNVTEVLDGLGDLTLSLDANVLDTGILDVDIPLGSPLDTNIDLDVNLNPTFDFTNSIADLAGLDILSDTLAELGGVVQAAQNTVNQVTDVVSDLDLDDPGASVDQLVETLGNLDETVGDITASVDDAVGGVLDNLGIGDGEGLIGQTDDDVLETVGDVIDDAGETLEGLADGLLSDNDGDASDEGLISQTADPVVDDVGNIVNDLTGGATDDLTDGLGDLTDNVTDLADNLTNGLTDGLLGENNNNAQGDSDITADALGLGDGVNVALDPVEDLAGDVDLDAGLNILGGGETDNNADDQDITVDTGIDLVDNTIVDEALDVPLDPVEEIIGDIDLNIGAAADLLGDQADGIVNNGQGGTGEDTLLSSVGDALGGIADGLLGGDAGGVQGGVTQAGEAVTEAAEESVADVAEGIDEASSGVDSVLGGIFGNDSDNSTGTDSDVTADAGADIVDHDVVDAVVETVVDPVEDLAGDLDINIDAATDILNPTNTDNDGGDSDVTAAPDIDLVDTDLLDGSAEVALDPVEALAGDIDADLGAAVDILGDQADGVVNDAAGGTGEDTLLADLGDGLNDLASDIVPGLNSGDNAESDLTLDTDVDVLNENLADTDLDSVLDPAEEIVGDIDAGLNAATDLRGDNETDNAGGDSDLTANVDLDIGGNDIADIPVDIPLDPVEEIAGDIDLDVSAALDLLNDNNPENSPENSEETGESSWTDSTITDGGGLFDDIANNTDGLGDALPDPAGTVAEGIGALDVTPELDVGSIGGLFG